MASQNYWASPPLSRQQMTLFAPTLDEMIGPDDTVRLVDEVLAAADWSAWEAFYPHQRGQPPIHPRFVAAALLYGLCRGLRSSRKLEEACVYRFDFLWLVEGRRIDHSTFCKFRTRFAQPLKDLFRQLGRVALTLGLIRLGEVAFDGTRVKANNSRYATRTAKTLEKQLKALDERFDELLTQLEANDAAEASSRGDASPTRLPKALAEVEQRRQRIEQALEQARAADAARQQKGTDPQRNPAQVPRTDSQSRVMPNKEGGYAPNYTPTVITDGQRGFIVDCDVTAEVNESAGIPAALDRVEETFGQAPEHFLTDAGNVNGPLVVEMEERGIVFLAPVASTQPEPGNPARRADPTAAVPAEQQAQLPRNSKGQLDKSCFVYDAAKDCYYCPQGQPLLVDKTKTEERGGQRVKLTVYRCADCVGCPLLDQCQSPQSKGGRTITRDEHEEARQRVAERLKTESGQALYAQRPRIVETTFGIMKQAMGLRQFLLRGLTKVQTEWRWAATAFNLGKLVREVARLRLKLGSLASGS